MSKYVYDLIKSKVDGFAYFSNYIRLRKIGSNYKGLCPFHSEKTPSLMVYPIGTTSKDGIKQNYASFFCFGCACGGDVIEFKRLQDGLNTRLEACEVLAKEFNIDFGDENVIKEIFLEHVKQMKRYEGNFKKPEIINLACSNMCRNYLNFIKEYYTQHYNNECSIIEKYYKHIDLILLDDIYKAQDLIEDIKNKLQKRIDIIKMS